MSQQHQIKWLLDAATSVFKTISDTAKLDAELLLSHVIDKDRTYLFTWSDKTLDEQQLTHFELLCERRKQGEPIAHIIGYREFWDLKLRVNPSTLIPRPDTEILVETALSTVADRQGSELIGLDLGTGTGAIALALSSELPNWQWLGVDLIPEAVQLAQQNKILNNINNCHFIQSSWFSQVPKQQYDLIVSNPPYIDKGDHHLLQGDVRFEPLSALVANNSGLSDILHIVSTAKEYLKPDSALIIEHGYQQGEQVSTIFEQFGFDNITTIKDLGGNDRGTVGYFKKLG